MESYSSNVTAVVEYLRENRTGLPFLVWRDSSPMHFDTPLGEFRCDGCQLPVLPFQCKVIFSPPPLPHRHCLTNLTVHFGGPFADAKRHLAWLWLLCCLTPGEREGGWGV